MASERVISDFSRKEIYKGIFVEKSKEQEKDQLFYIITVDHTIFKTLLFSADFSGSLNVEFQNEHQLKKEVILQPFTRLEAVRLLLHQGWDLKSKFNFRIELPDFELQAKFMLNPLKLIQEEISKTLELKTFDFNRYSQKEISTILESKKKKFVDHFFPPLATSICASEEEVREKYGCIVQFKRIPDLPVALELRENNKMIGYFSDEISGSNVVQGKLGDCWILSSISALAEYPYLIDRLFITKQPNDFGFYIVKLCRMGRWKHMILDDFIPCFPLEEPIFSTNTGNTIWVPLLEKAFAKHYGSFDALTYGDCKHALFDLTNCPSESFLFAKPWIRDMVDSGEFFQMMKQWTEQGYLITAGQFAQENELEEGLRGHAHALIRIVEVEDIQLLRFRNPWGIFEWDGRWSKNSELWTEELVNKIKPEFDADSFWLSFEDFKNNFGIVSLCKVSNWQQAAMRGKFITCTDINDPNFTAICSRYFYSLEITEKSKVIVGVHQEDVRSPGTELTRPFIDIGVAILKKSVEGFEIIALKETEVEREIFYEFEADVGTYFAIPISCGILIQPKIHTKKATITSFTLQDPVFKSIALNNFFKVDIDSSGTISYKELKSVTDLIGISLSENDYEKISSEFSQTFFGNEGLMTEDSFMRYFESLFAGITQEQIDKAFFNLGYTHQGFSFRTRVFNLTVHSKEKVKIKSHDALEATMDIEVQNLILKHYGKSIREDFEHQIVDVDLLCYFNKYINQKFSYLHLWLQK